MERCLHYCKEYRVEYSAGALNYNSDIEMINYLFDWLNYRTEHMYDIDFDANDIGYSKYVDWNKEGVKEAIVILHQMNDAHETWQDIPVWIDESNGDWSIDRWLRDSLVEAEKKSGFTPLKLANFLQDALDNGEQSIDYIRFTWL